MKARPYQRECIRSILGQFAEHSSTLASLATGLGKTVVFCTLANEWENGRVLILAHREELVFQAADKVRDIVGYGPGIEMADYHTGKADRDRIVVASVPTLCRPKRLAKFDPDEFGLVIADECHHAVSPTWLTIFDHFRKNPALKLLGVTATPKRADQLALGKVFDSVAFDYGIEPASDDGWLVPIRQRVVKVDNLDFSACRKIAGDFSEAELEAILTQEKPLHRVASATVEEAGDLPTLVFCVTVNHARLMTEVIRRYKSRSSANFVCGDSTAETRRRLLADFKAGRLQFLCNVGVLLEGFDHPGAACLSMARPTQSLTVYAQSLGRVTRTLPGVIDPFADGTPEQRRAAIAASAKPYALALDFVGNAGKHKIVSAADLLGGKYAAPVREYARKTLEEEGGRANVADALERAEAELALLAEEAEFEAARAKIKAAVDYRTYEVSPFGGVTSAHRDQGNAPKKPPADPATDKQIWKLVSLGVKRETARGYSKRQASAVIDDLMRKREQQRQGA